MTKMEKYGNKVAEAAALEERPEGVGSGSDSQLLPFIFKKEDNMKSARINFGIPESEYIMEVDDSGAATSLVNQDTGTEYVGGGGGGDIPEGYAAILFNTEEGILDKTWNEINTIFSDLGIGKVVIIPDNYLDYVSTFISQVIDDGHGGYSIQAVSALTPDPDEFFCSDPDDYPIYD